MKLILQIWSSDCYTSYFLNNLKTFKKKKRKKFIKKTSFNWKVSHGYRKQRKIFWWLNKVDEFLGFLNLYLSSNTENFCITIYKDIYQKLYLILKLSKSESCILKKLVFLFLVDNVAMRLLKFLLLFL